MISTYIKNGLGALMMIAAAGLTTESKAQKIVFEEPIKLPAVVNSQDAEEIYPILSQDGNSMYFVRAFHDDNTGGKNTGHDVWTVIKDSRGEWATATNAFPNINTRHSNAVVGISNDGRTLYLLNSYRDKEKSESGLAYSKKTGNTWSKPVDIAIPGLLPSTRLYGFFVSPDEKQMFITMEDSNSVGSEDLYVSLNENGQWSAPKNMGTTINTTGFEMSPFLAGDGKTLFYSSNRDGGKGNADIYMTKRLDDSWTNWSAPENMGLNTASFDAYFMMTKDSTVYFASNRGGDLSDIYKTKMSIRDTTKKQVLLAVAKTPLLIFFEFDKYALTPAAKAYLDRMVDSINTGGMEKVVLEGHADAIGTDKYNIELSRKRTNAARAYLVAKGVKSDMIETAHFGESRPMAANTTAEGSDNPAGRELNRRVEIKLTPEESLTLENIE